MTGLRQAGTTRRVLAILVCAWITQGATTQQQRTAVAQQPDMVHGRVVDAATGVPIEGARLFSATDVVGRTDADGRFAIPVTAMRVRMLRIEKGGYALGMVPRPDSSTAVEVGLSVGAALTAYVIDSSGLPAPGRRVRFSCRNQTGSTTGGVGNTDERGLVRLGYLPAGPCSIWLESSPVQMSVGLADQVRADDQLREREEMLRERAQAFFAERNERQQIVHLAPGEDATLTLVAPLSETLPAQMSATLKAVMPSVLVTGVVYDERGRPVEGVRIGVHINDPFAPAGMPMSMFRTTGPRGMITDDRGVYRVFVPPGRYYLSVSSGNDRPDVHPGGTAPTDAVVVDTWAGRDLLGIDIQMGTTVRPPLHEAPVN